MLLRNLIQNALRHTRDRVTVRLESNFVQLNCERLGWTLDAGSAAEGGTTLRFDQLNQPTPSRKPSEYMSASTSPVTSSVPTSK
jgi:hypothetical protein